MGGKGKRAPARLQNKGRKVGQHGRGLTQLLLLAWDHLDLLLGQTGSPTHSQNTAWADQAGNAQTQSRANKHFAHLNRNISQPRNAQETKLHVPVSMWITDSDD